LTGKTDPSDDTSKAGAGEAGADAPASAHSGTAIFDRTDPPDFSLRLRPHRSLGANGNGIVIAIAALGLSLPLLGLIGTMAAWGMLPFLVVVLLALYWAFRRNQGDARLTEELRLWPDLITVVRRDPQGRELCWHANPFWVEVRIHDDATIEKYLTLRGNGREIELGAFLSPWEREALFQDLNRALADVRAAGSSQFG
jgi:uncharacterized membrane protein